MDYELVIDLTDSESQAFQLSVTQFLSAAIPDFVVAKRGEYFASIKLKCNFNISRLQIKDKINNNSRPKELHGAVVKVQNVKRPAMSVQRLIQRHSARNKSHRHALTRSRMYAASTSTATSSSPHSSSPNSSPSAVPSRSTSSGRSLKNKNRTFVANNELISEADRECKQPLQSCLPSPLAKIPAAAAAAGKYNGNNNNNNMSNGSIMNNNSNRAKNNSFLNVPIAAASAPNNRHHRENVDAPPKYEEVVAAEIMEKQRQRSQQRLTPSPPPPPHQQQQQQPPHMHRDFLTAGEREWKAQHDYLPAYQRLPDLGNDEENEGGSAMRADEELKQIDHDDDDDVPAPAYYDDEDFAIALRLSLQEQEQHFDEDCQIAMRLHKAELERANREPARPSRFRNANFADWGSQPSDHLAQLERISRWQRMTDIGRLAAADDSNGHGDEDYDVSSLAQLQVSRGIAMAMNMDDDAYGVPFQIHRLDNDDDEIPREWRRLPVRVLSQQDVQHLQKSDEKRACHICLRDFDAGDQTRQLPCFHEFHKDCIDQWFVKQNANHNIASCPLDRKEIKDID
eukprot:CAMPEP_0202693748 /NCGR_PEP_ID=MMETSP1385-20130828/7784_1 /ASSEMBLY_ACC=CAM_ASM_000861 /TAXON_ID=933848 /ORGANISM="Elphidium margaritaceum" /LENGTH=567 /DNA_ID=CAMNT_0049349473 /DNA_START=55 /DNA_END=1758 /DNA_ORIENTATION=+